MPFYEYQCSACGEHREELQKITDRPLRKCPACGKNTLRRQLSAPAFRLKGGGWYETDFKADKDTQRNLAGDKEPAAVDKPPADKAKDDKTDAKPAEKPSTDAAATKPVDAKPKAATGKPAQSSRRRMRRRRR